MINKSNYEAFALDYLEGTLSATERREMEVFLQKNPVVAAELAEMKEIVTLVPDESIVFDNKNALLKAEEGARVIPMHRKNWFRLSLAAAAMLLLIGGYLAGYFTANMESGEEIIVDMPAEKVEKQEEIKVEEALAIEETIEENAAPIAKEIEKIKTRPKNNIEQKDAYFERHNIDRQNEEVANATPPKANNSPVEKSVSQQKEKVITIEKEEKEAVANQDEKPNIPEATPQKLLTPDTEITIATLPEKEVEINEIPASKAMEEIVAELPQPIALTETNEVEKADVAEGKSKKTLKKIGRFFGKLPFEGATASIIPTYYTDKKRDGK